MIIVLCFSGLAGGLSLLVRPMDVTKSGTIGDGSKTNLAHDILIDDIIDYQGPKAMELQVKD
jgi:hypothetical protein